MLWRSAALLVLLTPGLAGCTGTASLVRALAQDPATACVSILTIYGAVKIFRTAIPNGAVRCTQDQMQVQSATPKPTTRK